MRQGEGRGCKSIHYGSGAWEVTPEEEVRGWLGEVSDGDGEQWWS